MNPPERGDSPLFNFNLNFYSQMNQTGSQESALDWQTVDVVCLLSSSLFVVSSLLTSSWTQTDGGGNR